MEYKTFKFRLYPTMKQEEEFVKTLGTCRFVFNKFLEYNKAKYAMENKFAFGIELRNLLPEMKVETPWLKESNSQSLQAVSGILEKAIRQCYKNGAGFPKFKSRKSPVESFVIPQHFLINRHTVTLPKIGRIKYKCHRKLEGKIKYLQIVREVDRWYVCILCETLSKSAVIDSTKIVGIDVGIKTFAVTSNGNSFSLDVRGEEKAVKKYARKHSKKQKNSKNKEKSRKKLARKYILLKRKKEDTTNKIVSSITKNYDIVVAEDLNIKGMLKNKKLSRGIHRAAWGCFLTKLSYKAKDFRKVDRFFPSSKKCSCCGFVKPSLKLSERTFVCESCGHIADRDINAAINLKNTVGTAGSYACGEPSIKDSGLAGFRYGSMKQESSQRGSF